MKEIVSKYLMNIVIFKDIDNFIYYIKPEHLHTKSLMYDFVNDVMVLSYSV
jgi:hypothetical protein